MPATSSQEKSYYELMLDRYNQETGQFSAEEVNASIDAALNQNVPKHAAPATVEEHIDVNQQEPVYNPRPKSGYATIPTNPPAPAPVGFNPPNQKQANSPSFQMPLHENTSDYSTNNHPMMPNSFLGAQSTFEPSNYSDDASSVANITSAPTSIPAPVPVSAPTPMQNIKVDSETTTPSDQSEQASRNIEQGSVYESEVPLEVLEQLRKDSHKAIDTPTHKSNNSENGVTKKEFKALEHTVTQLEETVSVKLDSILHALNQIESNRALPESASPSNSFYESSQTREVTPDPDQDASESSSKTKTKKQKTSNQNKSFVGKIFWILVILIAFVCLGVLGYIGISLLGGPSSGVTVI